VPCGEIHLGSLTKTSRGEYIHCANHKQRFSEGGQADAAADVFRSAAPTAPPRRRKRGLSPGVVLLRHHRKEE